MIIKVCGLREVDNIRRIEMLDVDWLGFIFYPPSPRFITESSENVEGIGNCKKNTVGVFVNESLEYMLEKGKTFQFDIIQLHGNETPDICAELRQNGYLVIKAFSIESSKDFLQMDSYQKCCDYYLFDTKYSGYGGSGARFDWNLLEAYQAETPFLLSGGLSPDCSDELKKLHHPQFAGIDLNSGFELYPAMKDVNKIKNFIQPFRRTNTYNSV